MNSITYRITGLMFLVVTLTVVLLLYLTNAQMTGQFKEYLILQKIEMSPVEETFLASVHDSLIW